jgi:hypothetical protein
MRADAPRPAPALPAVVVDEAEVFADECRGVAFHGNIPDVGAITGQAELERLYVGRFANAARGLRVDTDGTFKDLLAHAKSQGVWRQG